MRKLIAEPKELVRIVKSSDQTMGKVLMALGLIIAFGGMGIAAYGLGTINGLSSTLVIGFILMVIGAIVYIGGSRQEH